MKMSTKGRYALRVMMELASHHGRGPLLVGTIAKNQGISANYIHVLVTGLRSAGLVRSVRGPSGGYELARRPGAITALDVITAVEGPGVVVECVTDASACPRANGCVAREVWCEVAAAVDGVLAGLTLEQLASRQRSKQEEPASYEI
ncbi:MAG: Rrf2 family transcriptional regulator [Candidatus Eisenbacteria bacterium]